MNTWQLCNEIKRVLNSQIWTGTTASQVFGSSSAIVTVGPDIEVGTAFRLPTALIRPLDAAVDPENNQQPDLLRQRIGLRLLNSVAGDPLGEAVLIGGFWVSGDTETDGRGLLEIEEEVFNAIKLLSEDSGIKIQLMASGAAGAQLIEELGVVAFRDYEFEAWVEQARHYPPATEFLAVATTASVSLTWVNPFTSRYDFRRMMLRRVAGSAPPGAATGTELTLASDTATSFTDTTSGSGVFSYAIFAVYDDRQDPPATDREFSESDAFTVTVP